MVFGVKTKGLREAEELVERAVNFSKEGKYNEAYKSLAEAHEVLLSLPRDEQEVEYFKTLMNVTYGLTATSYNLNLSNEVLKWSGKYMDAAKKLYKMVREKGESFSFPLFIKTFPSAYLVWEFKARILQELGRIHDALESLDEILGKEKDIGLPFTPYLNVLEGYEAYLRKIRFLLVARLAAPDLFEKEEEVIQITESDRLRIIDKYVELGYPKEAALGDFEKTLRLG